MWSEVVEMTDRPEWKHLGNPWCHAERYRCTGCERERSISNRSDQYQEAGELAAREDVDDHLNDVIEGLRHHADEIEEFLQEEYYR